MSVNYRLMLDIPNDSVKAILITGDFLSFIFVF